MHAQTNAGGGISYRMRLPSGERVGLGTDRGQALRKFAVLSSKAEPVAEVAVATLVKRHAKGAAQRRIEFAITEGDVRLVLAGQGQRCAVTGLPFRSDKPDGLRIRPWAPSLDRMDGHAGYVVGNVRVVCAFVNIAMNGFGEHFFSLVLEPLIQAAVKAELSQIAGNSPKSKNLSVPAHAADRVHA